MDVLIKKDLFRYIGSDCHKRCMQFRRISIYVFDA